jgi:ABC-type sugar transport system substrate-binding protein
MYGKTGALAAIVVIALTAAVLQPARAADQGREQQLQQAKEVIDTARFKKEPPYTIGLSAGYLTNSWVVFAQQHILYEAAQHDEIDEVIVTDANFNPAKQVADIEDLISKGVDLILYWPVDEQAIQGALTKAVDQGIATISTGGAFSAGPGTVANAYIDQWNIGELVARQLFEGLGGEGKIFAMLPIAGTTAAVDQLAALEAVMEEYPDMELLSAEYGDWNRAKAKQITENLLQRYPEIDGVFSPAGQMSIGVAEAFEEAGRLEEVVMSPGDEYNGWLKWVAEHGQSGAVTFPTRVGQEAVRLGLEILKGEPVARGLAVPSEYIAPAEIDQHVEMDRPDDWWASTLPEEWKPKS